MQITDIIPDFSKMSEAELREKIREIRRSRTTAKPVTLTKRPTKEASQATDRLAKEASKLSDADKEALKKLFGV